LREPGSVIRREVGDLLSGGNGAPARRRRECSGTGSNGPLTRGFRIAWPHEPRWGVIHY
jgi:hypothetical protein